MAIALSGRKISESYGDLLHISNSNNGVDSTRRAISDGGGQDTSLKLSKTSYSLAAPSDIWNDAQAATVGESRGILYTHGNFRTSLVSNGYRTSSGWQTLSANTLGKTGAAIIDLDPDGDIYLGTDTSKTVGSSYDLTTRLHISSDSGDRTAIGVGNTVAKDMWYGANSLVVGEGTGNDGLILYAGATSKSVLAFGKSGGATSDAYRAMIYYKHSDNKLWFTTNGDGWADSSSTDHQDAVVIESSGNVGIGCQDTGYKLAVNGNILSTPVDSGDYGREGGQFTLAAANGTTYNNTIHLDNYKDHFRVIMTTNEVLRIEEGGKVGIGEDQPDEKLHVNGNVKCDSTITGDIFMSNLEHEEGNSVDGTKGSWQIQEGDNDLFLINKLTDKKYKFALTEVS
jgi:hypothetical protein